MNSVLRSKFENFETCTDLSKKFINVIYAIESIIIYYSTIFFCHTRYFGYTNRGIAETILTRFHNVAPLTSAWYFLLVQSLDLLQKKNKIIKIKFPDDINPFIKLTLKKYYSENAQKENTLKTFCECFTKLKNKVCSHGGGINERLDSLLITEYQKYNFFQLPYLLIDFFDEMDISKLVSIESIKHTDDNLNINFIVMSDNINYSSSLELDSFEDELMSDQAYCYFEEGSQFISTKPFFTLKDMTLRYYNGINNKKYPEYQDFNSLNYIEIKANTDAFSKLVNEDIDIYNHSEIPSRIQFENETYHNLPKPPYQQFIGRTELLAKIKSALLNKRLFIISISGIGGVGKSAIALEIANKIINSNNKDLKFSFIIWVSAKKTYLTDVGIITESQSFETLNQLLDLILRITNFSEGLDYTLQKKKNFVLDVLSLDSFLIIIDNFETLENIQLFIDFFEEVGDRCYETKIIITSRRQLGTSEKIIDIREMGGDEYDSYVDYLSNRNQLPFEITRRMKEKLYSFTGGLPLATEFILSRIKKIDDLQKTISRIEEDKITKESILDFSYNESFALLGENEKKVLYTITLVENAKIQNITYISRLDEFDVEEAIGKLKMLSFINVDREKGDDIYSVLSLTRIFVDKVIKGTDIENEISARYEEYNNIMQQVGFDTTEYDIPLTSDSIGIKYAKAAYIQAREHKFKESEENFNKAISINPDEAEIWYLWARALFDSSGILNRKYFEKASRLAKLGLKEKILFEFGKALINTNKYDDCIRIFRDVISINPENINAYHFIGKAHYEIAFERNQMGFHKDETTRKHYEKSRECFERCLCLNPQTNFEIQQYVINCYYLARIYRHLGQFDKSKEYISKGLSFQPYNRRLLDLLKKLEVK